MTITEDQLEAWIRQLIKENKLEKFYKWREWRELSEQIKKENNYECQLCKKRGIHTPARSVHHVQWVRKHPHKRVKTEFKKEHFVNEERW